jgi:hypothetical protein
VINAKLFRKSPASYGNRRFFTFFFKQPSSDLTYSQKDIFHTLARLSTQVLNFFLQQIPSGYPFLSDFRTNTSHAQPLDLRVMQDKSQTDLFYTTWSPQHYQFLTNYEVIMCFVAYCLFLRHWIQTFSQHFVLKHPKSVFCSVATEQISHQYKTINIIIGY